MKKYAISIITICMFFISAGAYAKNEQYIIFMDAGSSGSRIHIFQYDKSYTIPLIKDVYSETIKPGISSYANNPESVGPSLKNLFDHASEFLKTKGVDLKSTQINILATAGMRLLPAEKQHAIYTHLEEYLKHHYEFTVGDIQTIAGKMEGIYGWLDINYLLGNFDGNKDTVGSIDMGGASTQIAFATNDTSKPADSISIALNNQRYTVFSKSFLGLGQDQAMAAMNKDLTANSCYPQNYELNKKLSGSFDATRCGTIYSDLIKQQQVEQQMIPTTNRSFIAYSGIYYTYNFFNVDKTPDQFSLISKIQQVCSKPWEQLQQEYSSVPDKFLSTYCANGVYHSQLLYNTYHIKDDQLTVANQIQQKDIDWTLGAALYALTQK